MNLFPINIDTNLMGIKADNSFISDQYLFYFILRARLSRIADTSTIPQINNIHINPITINIPSLEEQEKITRFLGLLDERIVTQRRLIEDLEKLNPQLLTEYSQMWMEKLLSSVTYWKFQHNVMMAKLNIGYCQPVKS